MTVRKCWIFDIDGTLADIEHRRHFVASKPKNWPAFNAAMVPDGVIPHTADLLRQQFAQGMGIVLCSGRGSDARGFTEQWLDENSIPYHALYMRAEKDYRSDYIVKSELLDRLRADGWNPQAVVDDRLSVCRMWMNRGLFVFCVNQGFVEF